MTVRWIAPVAAGAAAIALASCATTTFNATWKNPEAQPVKLAGAKVAAVVVTPNESTRRVAEDVLVRELNARGAQGLASYSFISTENLKDKDRAKGDFQKAGVDGAVVMRVVSANQELSYSPGMAYTPGMWGSPYYGSFWGYYGWGWGMAYDPGYLRTDTIVSVETTVYSLKQDKILWGGMSETMNPSKAEAFMKELADGVAKQMTKAGLLR
jgi:hypothetical protein